MARLRYALGVLVGLAFLVAAGAVATAPEAAAGSEFGSVRPIAANWLPKIIKRIIPNRNPQQENTATERESPATGGQPARTNQATNPNPLAKKPGPAPLRPKKSRSVARLLPPGRPHPRPQFFPDDLDNHPLGKFLPGSFDTRFFLALLPFSTDEALAEQIAEDNEYEISEILPLPLLDAQLVRYEPLPGQSVYEAVVRLAGDPRIVDVYLDFYFHPADATATTSIQYAPKKIHVEKAHQIAKGRDVLVAVIDSGIDAEHPELKTSVVEHFEAIDFDPADEKRHGTAMAAVIAANSQLLGVAPSVQLLSARAFGVPKGGGKASATTFAILKSMQWSFDRGARIFNLSFAGPRDPALIIGLDALAARDVIMVAAAGNAGPDAPPAYPGAHSGVIAVTATDTADVLFDKANNGKYIALAAPGVDVMTASPGKRYELMSGTSVAAAHVTGVVALMMEKDPGLKPAAVRQTLSDTATDLGPEGPDSDYGAGLVDALGALKQTGRSKVVVAD